MFIINLLLVVHFYSVEPIQLFSYIQLSQLDTRYCSPCIVIR
jgi:hypothetical protein